VCLELVQFDDAEARSTDAVLRRPRQVAAAAQHPPRRVDQRLDEAHDVELGRRLDMLEHEQLATLRTSSAQSTHDNQMSIGRTAALDAA